MTRRDNGGPAFPRSGFYPPTSPASDDWERTREMLPSVTEPTDGMTLFDYYLGIALGGILANPRTNAGQAPANRTEAAEFMRQCAVTAVGMTAVLMAARAAHLGETTPDQSPEGDEE